MKNISSKLHLQVLEEKRIMKSGSTTNRSIKISQKDVIDPFTPDNTPETAVDVTKRKNEEERRQHTRIRTISPANDVDYFVFEGKKGVEYGMRCEFDLLRKL